MKKITAFLDISYGQHDRCTLDLFRPADERRAPLVICIHGGGWIGGQRLQYEQTCVELARNGFAAATIGYRLMPDALWPEMAFDVLKGIACLSERADELGIDAGRAVTFGSSAGGHMALVMQAKADQWVRQGIVAKAPRIVGTVAQCPATALEQLPEMRQRIETLRSGGDWSDFSPSHMQPALFTNVLVIHGDADKVIPIEHSRQFVDRLSQAGVAARLIVLPGVDHAFGYRLTSGTAIESLHMAIPCIREMLLAGGLQG